MKSRSIIGIFVIGAIFMLAFSHSPETTTAYIPPATPVMQPTPQAAANDSVILDLFEPTITNAGGNQLAAQIEQAILVSFILTNCGRITQQEYSDSFNALVIYARRMKLAPTPEESLAEVRNLAESARANYELRYNRSSCVDPHLFGLADSLKQWRRAITAPQKP